MSDANATIPPGVTLRDTLAAIRGRVERRLGRPEASARMVESPREMPMTDTAETPSGPMAAGPLAELVELFSLSNFERDVLVLCAGMELDGAFAALVSEAQRAAGGPAGPTFGFALAVLDAMGLLPPDRPFVHESLIGTLFRGSVVRRSEIAGLATISPEVEGAAWITGEHAFLIDDDDPLREGFCI